MKERRVLSISRWWLESVVLSSDPVPVSVVDDTSVRVE